jgi:subtilisin family serine protease
MASSWVLLDVVDGANVRLGGSDPIARGRALEAKLEALKQSGLFAHVEPDYVRTVDVIPTDSALTNGSLWGLHNAGEAGGISGADIDALGAWGITGGSSNVIVAVIDTGLSQTHPELLPNLWRNPGEIPGNGIDDDGDGYIDNVYGVNVLWPSEDPRAGYPLDDHRHGTHCAGTIAAAANDGHPHVGVAWQTRVMACKFLNSFGSGFDSDAIKCIEFAISHGARVLNCSWGGSEFSHALYDAMAVAGDQGVLIVAGAGNSATDMEQQKSYPAGFDLENIVSVAAIDRYDDIALFSDFGWDSVDVGAPGVEIVSCDAFVDSDYLVWSGTSMACPHVSGTAALVLAQYPNISLGEWRARLVATAVATPALYGRTASGGRLNAYRALTAMPDGALKVCPQLLGAVPVRDGTNNVLYVVSGQTNTLQLRVNDLLPVTNATVQARIAGGPWLELQNDGLAPDRRAGDGSYAIPFVVPTVGESLAIEWAASAPGKSPASGEVTARIERPPVNDNFDDRLLLFDSVEVNASNIGATREPGEIFINGWDFGHTVWWAWTAPADGKFNVLITNSTMAIPIIEVYRGIALGSLEILAVATGSAAITARAGQTYIIAVDGFGGRMGKFTLRISPGIDVPRNPPVIVREPRDVVVERGLGVCLDVGAQSASRPSYYWSFNNQPVATPDSSRWPFLSRSGLGVFTNGFLVRGAGATNVGNYQVVVSNAFGCATSRVAQLSVVEPRPTQGIFDDFEGGIDTGQWDGVGPGLLATNYGGAVSGTRAAWLDPAGVNALTTRLLNATNGGTIRFWIRFGAGPRQNWRAPSEPSGEEHAAFAVGLMYTSPLGPQSGVLATFVHTNYRVWTRVEIPIPPEARLPLVQFSWIDGLPELRGYWALDDVEVDLLSQPEQPTFTRTMSSVMARVGEHVSLRPEVRGAAPVTFRWFHDGSILPYANQQSWNFFASTNDGGSYELLASNAFGVARSGPVQVTVLAALTLSEALDTTNQFTAFGYFNNLWWKPVTDVTHDGRHAVQSPAFIEYETGNTRLETTVQGPGTVGFWWKVEAGPGNEGLSFVIDEQEMANIVGRTPWLHQTFDLLDGLHRLWWYYPEEHDGDINPGVGWVDQFVFIPAPAAAPTMVSILPSRPISPWLPAGESVLLTASAHGNALSYQWRMNGTNLPGATQQVLALPNVSSSRQGNYHVLVSNALGHVESAPIYLRVASTNDIAADFAAALETTNLFWTTYGRVPWYPQNSVAHDNVDAAASSTPASDDNEDSWLETEAAGPGTLSFWWKLSSEPGVGQLFLYDNAQSVAYLQGEADWRQEQFHLLAGLHRLRWQYHRGNDDPFGLDRGWLDQVTYVPGVTMIEPSLSDAVDNQSLDWSTGGATPWRGQTAVTHDGADAACSTSLDRTQTNWLRANVEGPATLGFWWKISSSSLDRLWLSLDGTNLFYIAGETDWQFALAAIPTGQHDIQWVYQHQSSYLRGMNRCWVDEVVVTPATAQFVSGGMELLPDALGGLRLNGPPGRLALTQTSTNLQDWVTVSTNLFTSHGTLEIRVPVPSDFPAAFFRVRIAP